MNVKNIIKEIKKENDKEARQIKDKIMQALRELEKLKRDFLEIDPDIEKIILFGSLAEGNIKSIRFDIDIAVKSKKYYQLVGKALQSEFKIDVVDLDTIHNKIKNNILEKGKIIYEKR